MGKLELVSKPNKIKNRLKPRGNKNNGKILLIQKVMSVFMIEKAQYPMVASEEQGGYSSNLERLSMLIKNPSLKVTEKEKTNSTKRRRYKKW